MNMFEEKLCYPALALIVLAVFYGIYFGKMLVQKRHGICTHQIGRRKEQELHTVETLMSIATLGTPIAQLLSIAFGWSHLPAGGTVHRLLRRDTGRCNLPAVRSVYEG